MKQSQKLPDGVGKRIIEALKQQTEQPNDSAVAAQQEGGYPQHYHHQSQEQAVNPAFAPYQPENVIPYQQQEPPSFQPPRYMENEPLSVDEKDFSLNDNYSAPVQDNTTAPVSAPVPIQVPDMQQYEVSQNNSYQSSVTSNIEQEEVVNNNYTNGNVDSQPSEQVNYHQQPQVPQIQPPPPPPQQQEEVPQVINEQPHHHQKQSYVHSSNIDTLMWLITQLPAGVTKQTGAHIIRQTMEALGMPMNLVLNEAQQIQDTTNHSIRNKINSIEEYRNNIRILESEVQRERKQVEELEDLISLFILSEKS